MVINGSWKGNALTLSLKPNCLVVSCESGAFTNVYSYDFEGRLWASMHNGISYRRGLDGKIIARWMTSPNQHARRWLLAHEAEALLTSVHQVTAELVNSLQTEHEIQLSTPLPPALLPLLIKADKFVSGGNALDTAEFSRVYKPIGILPPDQYMAVVLQMTEGCSYNACTFCSFYRDRPFRVKSPTEFTAHIQAVRQFLAQGESLRRTIFLGDANSLVVSTSHLLPLLEIVHQHFEVARLGGIYAFLDGFNAERKSPQDYQKLAALGLKRIYIGLESGSQSLLQFLKKPGSPQEILQAVKVIKAGGVSVGIIVLLGAGGQHYASEHVAATIKLINAMQLDMDDLIYFSELVESEEIPYVRDAFQAKLIPLTPQERLLQAAQIEAGLRFDNSKGIPHISRYDIREFVY